MIENEITREEVVTVTEEKMEIIAQLKIKLDALEKKIK